MQGTRTFLADRGVQFAPHNPTVGEIVDRVAELRSNHGRHRGHKGCAEAADLLEKILKRNGWRAADDHA